MPVTKKVITLGEETEKSLIQLEKQVKLLERDETRDSLSSRETFIESPYLNNKVEKMLAKLPKKVETASDEDDFTKNKYFKRYKKQWDHDLKHLILDYQKTLHNAGSVIKHNHLYHPFYANKEDIAHSGLNGLWQKYEEKPLDHIIPPHFEAATPPEEAQEIQLRFESSNNELMELKESVLEDSDFFKKGKYIPESMDQKIVARVKAAYFRERLKTYGKWYYQPDTFDKKFQ